jgi:4-hydroxybenzoyl-CoA thioesterase
MNVNEKSKNQRPAEKHPVNSNSIVNRKAIRIEWGDCDPAGIVYYPRYCAYFDNCTTALFAHAGIPKHEMLKTYQIVGIPMVHLELNFVAPSRFGDEVVVESCVSEWKRSSFFVHHKLLRGDELAVECFETRVWAVRSAKNPEEIKAQPVPRDVIERFSVMAK